MPSVKQDCLTVLHDLVREHPDFDVVPGSTHNEYCFRYIPNSLVERQEEPDVQALLDVLNEEIVQAVQHNGFAEVRKILVRGHTAIRTTFCSGTNLAEDVEATFEALARWGRLLNKKLSARYKTDMERELCSSELHSSPTEVSAT